MSYSDFAKRSSPGGEIFLKSSKNKTRTSNGRQAAVEALHALYSRSNYNPEEFQPLVYFMYQTDHLTLLRQVYEWSVVSARNVDETRYAISKKLSEVCMIPS